MESFARECLQPNRTCCIGYFEKHLNHFKRPLGTSMPFYSNTRKYWIEFKEGKCALLPEEQMIDLEGLIDPNVDAHKEKLCIGCLPSDDSVICSLSKETIVKTGGFLGNRTEKQKNDHHSQEKELKNHTAQRNSFPKRLSLSFSFVETSNFLFFVFGGAK